MLASLACVPVDAAFEVDVDPCPNSIIRVFVEHSINGSAVLHVEGRNGLEPGRMISFERQGTAVNPTALPDTTQLELTLVGDGHARMDVACAAVSSGRLDVSLSEQVESFPVVCDCATPDL
jgi:hypothetical protein